MSFVSVLKKIGTVLLDGSQIATEVMGFPFLSHLIGDVTDASLSGDFSTLATIISSAEAMFPSTPPSSPAAVATKTGPAKLTASAPLVQQKLLAWAKKNLPGHNKIHDQAKLNAAAAGIASNWADFMNSLGE
jgi:hypothetical protein